MITSEERPLKYYWSIIRSRKWLFIFTFVTTVLATILGSFLWTPSYESTATILLDYANPNPLDIPVGPHGSVFSSEYMLTEKSIVESRSVISEVIKMLGLEQNPSIKLLYEQSLSSTSSPKLFFWRKMIDYRSWLIEFLSEGLRVEPRTDTRILAITFSSADPRFSAMVANAFAQAYSSYHLALKVSPLKESVDWISRKVEELRKNVEEKEKGLEEYKAAKGVVDPNDQYSIAVQKLNQLNTDLVASETRLYETSIKMEQLKKLTKKDDNYESLPEVIASSLIQNLKVDKIRLEKELSELSKRFGLNHPKYLSVVAELNTVNEKMKSEIDNIIKGIRNDYESAKERRRKLKSAVERQKKRVLIINKETFDLNTLALEADTTRKIYDTLLTKFSETTLRGDINRTNVIIIDEATPSSEPTAPMYLLNFALSLIVGPILGIVVIFFQESLDNTIKSARDLEADFGLAVLGVIPGSK